MRVLCGLVGAMVLTTAAQAAEMPNTNLLCTGTEKIMRDGQPTITRKFQKVYRIDYVGKQWCEDTCKDIKPIMFVTDDTIGLSMAEIAGVSVLLRIDRIKGEVEGLGKLPLGDGKVQREYFTGPCITQPFTAVESPAPGPKPVPKF